MLYEKETCHGCEKGFEPGDDTVVCPVCGTPQHRACWLERKACVNESLHADGFIWRAAVAQDEPKNPSGFDPKKDIGKICPNCGTNNPAGSKICAVCKKTIAEEEKQAVVPAEQPSAPAAAAEMPAQPKPAKIPPFLAGISADEVISGVKALDIALYIQLGAKRYLEKFRKIDLTGVKFGWSWAAFIFSPYWFFYRKLYWLGGIFLGLTFAVSVFFAGPVMQVQQIAATMPMNSLTPADVSNFYAQIAGYYPAILGMFGLSLLLRCAAALAAVPAYKKKVVADISSLRRFAKDENVFRALVIRRGGASGLALFGSVLLYDLLWMLINQTVRQL